MHYIFIPKFSQLAVTHHDKTILFPIKIVELQINAYYIQSFDKGVLNNFLVFLGTGEGGNLQKKAGKNL